jgi:lipopolysaccharide/colanic/teichoic acid biosynthesis glycosyltransferase
MIYRDCLKRVFDFTTACAGLTVLSIPILLVAVLNLMSVGRPVFFVQGRVGRHARIFPVIKFRTMHTRTTPDSPVTVRGDARVTPLGAFLRRCKLDELPQLWNVLRGDMSFVGPRPDVPGYMDKLEGADRLVLELRPGITGPATLKYKNEEEILAAQDDPVKYNDEVIFPDKVRINLEYRRRCSLWLDLRIILITAGVMKSRRSDFWMS